MKAPTVRRTHLRGFFHWGGDTTGMAATYRIVGVRADGSRAVLSVRLPLDDATWVRDTLIAATIFADVLIEPDEPKPGNGEKTSTPAG